MNKCITCGKEIEPDEFCSKPKWCNMGCKKQFYIDNYAGSGLVEMIEKDLKDKHHIAKQEFIEWLKNNPNKGMVEYLQSLGDFKSDNVDT